MDQFFHCTSKKLLTLKNSKKYLSKLAYITLSHRFTDLSCECKNVVQTCPELTLFLPTCNRKVILNINIIYFWTWAVLISTKSSRAHFQLFSCLAIFWDLGRKEEKTTCKVTWAKDRRAGETRKLFEHAADVRDSANTEYSTLSHIESCPLNEICPVCVWV